MMRLSHVCFQYSERMRINSRARDVLYGLLPGSIAIAVSTNPPGELVKILLFSVGAPARLGASRVAGHSLAPPVASPVGRAAYPTEEEGASAPGC